MTKKARRSLPSEAPGADQVAVVREGDGRTEPDEDAESSSSEEELGFARNYFLAKEVGGASRRKSAKKVADINAVDEQVLRATSSGLVTKHEKEIRNLLSSYSDLYPKWLFELRCGFGILTYGFGSKKSLLEDFASSTLTNYSVVIINGYLQTINLKQVVLTLAELLWDQLKARQKSSIRNGPQIQRPFSSQTMEDLISFLDEKSLRDIDIFVCVLVHNIDGPGLRDCESQQCLAQIACCSGVRMIASIDHINAPLLWDKKMVHKQFNWCWYHVPTFVPYKVEGVFFPLILASGSTAQNAKTALIVLQSLTPNAQSVFKVLAEYQLAHPKEEGMPMNALYSMCREHFLVSSQVTLNSHLVEFKDHDLVKIRRNSEGQDCYYVPLSPEGLEKLLQELN